MLRNLGFIQFGHSIYLNGTQDYYEIQENKYLDLDGIQKVEIYNVLGKIVYRNDELTSNRISLSELKKGIYFLTIYCVDNKAFNEKVIKL